MKRMIALAALLLPFALAGCSHPQPVPYYPPPPPPPTYSQVAQRGFHDGLAAAQKDIRAGFAPDVNRHPRFRNPPAPPELFEDYRHGFRDGYQQIYRRGQPPPPPAN